MTESSLEEVPAAMRRVSGILDGAGGHPPWDGDADYLAGHEIGCRVHEAKSAASAIIKAPTIGSISEHPDGYRVDVVAEDSGCFFWYRVESDTLSRTGRLEAGPWRKETERAETDVLAMLHLMKRNTERRQELVSELRKIREEIEALSARARAVIEHLTKKGRQPE